MSQIIQVHTIIATNLMSQIGQKRNVDLAQSSLIAWRVDPGKVSEMRVDLNAKR